MLGTISESMTWLPYFLFGTGLIIWLVHIMDSRWAKQRPRPVWYGLNLLGLGLTLSLSAELSLLLFRQDTSIRLIHLFGALFSLTGLLLILIRTAVWYRRNRALVIRFIGRLTHLDN
jgi:hypothetical protein